MQWSRTRGRSGCRACRTSSGPYITEEDFAKFNRHFAGALGESHAAWEVGNENQLNELVAAGHDPRRVTVSYGDVVRFCDRNGHQMDRESLRRFVEDGARDQADADAADAFAAQVRKSALMSERDGLHVFTELAQKKRQRAGR